MEKYYELFQRAFKDKSLIGKELENTIDALDYEQKVFLMLYV